ncbi:MAG TPA: hypothetical protein VD973_15290 [Symbiobacteriaceae bacterium]|nr:hypothetical protein [Symbiobacteriaceae bacterium]
MKIGLISCTKSKTAYQAPARELYSPSALFRGALGYLEARADVVYVLSAKYGLMPLDQVAAPYVLTLKDYNPTYRKGWAMEVLREIKARHGASLAGVEVEFHAGEAYTAHLRPLLEATGATCVSPVEGMTIGERLHFYASGEVAADEKAATRKVAAAVAVKQGTGLKIHAEVWLAAALLHEEGHATFSSARLVEEVERRFDDVRPGVQMHASSHCVANAARNTVTEYCYLFRTGTGELRLYRKGDPLHPTRSGGRTAPDQADVPEPYWDVWRKWSQRP